MAGALDGLRVVDLSRVLAGPYCTQMLADHGAEVIKVEPPDGDETRRWGPPFLPDGTSAYFRGLNRNKRNIALNLSGPAGQRVLADLLADADVLIENFKVGTLARWGFDDESVRARFPRLVHCRITGFGSSGPQAGLPGYDAVLQAYSGLMSLNGVPGAPLRIGTPVVDLCTGLYAFLGILLALRHRERSQRGQIVDCSLLDSALSLLHPHGASWLATGIVPEATGSAHPTIAPYDNYPTRTVPVFVGAGSDEQFRRLLDALELTALFDDPRFRTNASRLAHGEELRELLVQRLAELDGAQVAEDLLARGVPSSPIHDVAQALSSAQAAHQQMLVSLPGGYRGLGVPVKLSDSPGAVTEPPRACGEDTTEVLETLGYSAAQIERLLADGVAFRPQRGAEPQRRTS